MSTLSILHVPILDTVISDDSSQQHIIPDIAETPLLTGNVLRPHTSDSSVLSSPISSSSENLRNLSSRYIPQRTRSFSFDLDVSSRYSTNNSFDQDEENYFNLATLLTNSNHSVMPGGGGGKINGLESSSGSSSSGVVVSSTTNSQQSSSSASTFSVRGVTAPGSSTITRARTNSGPPRPSFIKTNLSDNYYYGGSDDSTTSPLSTNSSISAGSTISSTTDRTTNGNGGPPHYVRHRDSFQSAGPFGLPAGGLSSAFIPSHSSNQQLHHLHNPKSNSGLSPISRKVRSKSFSETVTETSQEAIRQLAPPISLPLVLTCIAWYGTSAMSNTLNKSILTAFPYPVSLSMVQFTLAASFGISTIKLAQASPDIAHALPKGIISPSGVGLRLPTKAILMATAPMGMFQLSGHILSHMSTSLIPVSLVHTIKALSPLFTVAAYRLLFGVSYKRSTYLSLIPLTLGVIMTCSVEFSSHFMGIIYALVAALIFVSQNMFSKKLLTSGNTGGDDSTKLDKLNILCYCSSLAFIFTFPLWFFSEGISLISDYSHSSGDFFGSKSTSTDGITTTTGLLFAFLTNGFVHFAQNLLAFQVLGMVSPVTYSVASLIKRIVVITVAILWFGQTVTGTQGWGILLTFLGLYLYDRCGGDKSKNYESKATVLPK